MSSLVTSLSPKTTTNGVATALSATQIFCASVIIYADNLNTGNVYIGGPSVSVSNGIPLRANQSQNLSYDLVWGGNGKIDLSKIYLDTDQTGNAVRIVYVPWIGG